MDNTRGTLLEIKRAAERKTNNASWDAPVFEKVYKPTTEGQMSDTMDIVHSIFGRMGEVMSKMRAKFADDLSLGEMKGEIEEQRRQRQMANMQAMQSMQNAQLLGGGSVGSLGASGLGNLQYQQQVAHQAAFQNALSNQALAGALQPLYGLGQTQHYPVYQWPQHQPPIAVPSAPNEPTGNPVGLMEDEVIKEWRLRKAKT